MRITPALLAALLVPTSAWAVEVTGQIRGETVDAEDLSVPGVTLTISSPNLQGTRQVVSDDEGRFLVTGLPPGEYTVAATKDTFLPYRAKGVLVVSGQSAYLRVEMRPAVGGAEVTVEDVRPAVDTQKVSSGAVLSRETMKDIPVPFRDYQSLTGLAPGVVGSGNANVRGSFDDSNQFYMDGVNNTDPITGTFSMNMNYDAIEEVQVITGGMDAEYGRSLGGAINIVTRSGGNEIHGDAQFLFSNQALRWYKPLEGDDTEAEYQNQQLALNVGGPIIKDKLWYFASLEGAMLVRATPVDASVGRPEEFPMAPRNWRSLYYFGKLTWSPSDSQRLWVQVQGDPTYIENTEQDPYTLPEGETIQEQGGFVVQGSHIWTQGDKGVLQSQLYFQKSRIDYYSVGCKGVARGDLADCIRNLDNAWMAWYPDEFNGGKFPYGYMGDRNRQSLNVSYTRFGDLLGRHQFKVGGNAERLQSASAFPGVTDWTFKAATGDTTDIASYENLYQVRYVSELSDNLTGYLFSGYVQDVWNPTKQLTIRPGVRLDYSSLGNDVGETVFAKATIAPRFGVAYDFTNDGRTSGHAYYGRFYDSGFLAVSDLLHSNSQGYAYYAWDPELGDWAQNPVAQVGTSNLIYDDLKNPYSDEFDVGLSRDVGNGWAVDATFTYEKSRNFWEDDEVNLIWNEEGTDVIGYRNGVNEAIYRIRTPDEAFNTYTGLEVSVARQFSENFSMLSSYTWSHAYGTNDSQFATGVFDNPEQEEYEVGLLGYDRTHQLKVMGSLRDPDALRASDKVKFGYLWGWNYYIVSGAPYRPVYYNNYYQDWYNYQEVLDGTYRLPAEAQLDLKLGITSELGPTKWDLTIEMFNVLNDRTITGVNTAYDDPATGGPLLNDDGSVLFGTPTTRQQPRNVQLGLRGEF